MNQQRDGRLGIGIIGAGKVGPILGAALAGAGHALVGISAISEESKERAQAILPDVPVLEVPRIVELSELVLIAVPDEELPDLVNGLAVAGVWQPGQIVLHTSAACPGPASHCCARSRSSAPPWPAPLRPGCSGPT